MRLSIIYFIFSEINKSILLEIFIVVIKICREIFLWTRVNLFHPIKNLIQNFKMFKFVVFLLFFVLTCQSLKNDESQKEIDHCYSLSLHEEKMECFDVILEKLKKETLYMYQKLEKSTNKINKQSSSSSSEIEEQDCSSLPEFRQRMNCYDALLEKSTKNFEEENMELDKPNEFDICKSDLPEDSKKCYDQLFENYLKHPTPTELKKFSKQAKKMRKQKDSQKSNIQLKNEKKYKTKFEVHSPEEIKKEKEIKRVPQETELFFLSKDTPDTARCPDEL
jgi:hypothetical protein